MAIVRLIDAWSQVTSTVPLPVLIAASSTNDQVTVREAPTVCGPSPAAVLFARLGVRYSMEQAAPSCVCTVTVTAWPGVLPCTDRNCTSLVAGCGTGVPPVVGLALPTAERNGAPGWDAAFGSAACAAAFGSAPTAGPPPSVAGPACPALVAPASITAGC